MPKTQYLKRKGWLLLVTEISAFVWESMGSASTNNRKEILDLQFCQPQGLCISTYLPTPHQDTKNGKDQVDSKEQGLWWEVRSQQ